MSRPRRVVVVGGGIAGLSCARAARETLRAAHVPAEVTVLEASERAGGLVRSERRDGFLCEWGPEGVLDDAPATRELVAALGLSLEPTTSVAKRRFLFKGGRLVAAPQGPAGALRTPLLSPRAKLRAVAELAVPRRKDDGVRDESVLAFARRRFGVEIAETVVDPIVSGVFAGDAAQLSMAASFPRLAELERRHGSVLRGAIASARAARKAGGGGATARGRLVSFPGGMEDLTLALVRDLGPQGVRTGAAVRSVMPRAGGHGPGHGFRVVLADGAAFEADAVVLAVPAANAAAILEPLDGRAGRALRGIGSVELAVVFLGYERAAVPHPLDGFGYLCPRVEERRLLGALFSSSLFPGRAPAGMHLVRALAGGARDPSVASMPEEELLAMVRQELRAALGVTEAPAFTRIVRHRPAIPQYTLGHLDRVAEIDAGLERVPGLYVAGNAYRGVGLNDVVRESSQVAARLADRLAKLPHLAGAGYDSEAWA